MGDLERIAYAVSYADQSQAAAILLMIHIGTDQRADAGGVDVRDFGQVEDERAGGITANLGLELEEIRNQDRSLEVKNAVAMSSIVDITD